jgi:hypothetical protein
MTALLLTFARMARCMELTNLQLGPGWHRQRNSMAASICFWSVMRARRPLSPPPRRKDDGPLVGHEPHHTTSRFRYCEVLLRSRWRSHLRTASRRYMIFRGDMRWKPGPVPRPRQISKNCTEHPNHSATCSVVRSSSSGPSETCSASMRPARLSICIDPGLCPNLCLAGDELTTAALHQQPRSGSNVYFFILRLPLYIPYFWTSVHISTCNNSASISPCRPYNCTIS